MSVQKAVQSVCLPESISLCVSAAQPAQVVFNEFSFVSWLYENQLGCNAQRVNSCYMLGQMFRFVAFGEHS